MTEGMACMMKSKMIDSQDVNVSRTNSHSQSVSQVLLTPEGGADKISPEDC